MAIDTYLKLKNAVEDISKRTDIANHLDTFLALAESDMWQNLSLREMEGRSTATLSTTNRFIALPDDYLRMRKITLQSGLQYYDLTFSTPESMKITSPGRPRAYAVTSQIEFDRTPDSAYTVEAQFYKSTPPLTEAASTNSILTKYPALYLYGTLFHYAQWAHDDRALIQYSDLFDEEIRRTNKVTRKARYGPSPAMRITGSTP